MLVLTKSATRRWRSDTSAGGAKFRSITLPFAVNLAGDGPAETQSSANPFPCPDRLSLGGDRKGGRHEDARVCAVPAAGRALGDGPGPKVPAHQRLHDGAGGRD